MAHPKIDCTSDCFGCKIASVGFGYKYGREAFHGPGIAHRRAEAIRDAKAQGNEPVELTRKERREFHS